MRKALVRVRNTDEGLSTAEYACGTVAVAGLGGLLIKLLSSSWFFDLLQQIITKAFSAILG
jgi:hypothetical protein